MPRCYRTERVPGNALESGTVPTNESPPRARRILHVDMDAFFAAVELRRRPELRGKPIIVGGAGDPTRRGVVSTASYEARTSGVHSGMSLRTARRRCPEAVFLPVDMQTYVEASREVKAILREYSPVVQDMGIDEAYLDATASDRTPEELARAIKRRIRVETGLTCSIGIAPNKLLAKLASDMDKPDGITILEQEDVESRVWPLPARALRGVGPKTERALRELGIRTIGDLAAAPSDALVERFGSSHGEHLHRAAHGVDASPLVTRGEPKSRSREITFQQDVDDRAILERDLKGLTRDVVDDLVKRGYRGRNVTVKLRYTNFVTRSHGTTVATASDDFDELWALARACLSRFPLERKVRLIGVRVASLERRQAV